MAGGGVGEAMLIGAAVGATAGGAGAAIQGGDPLQGAITGGVLGAVGGGISGALPAGAAAVPAASTTTSVVPGAMAGAAPVTGAGIGATTGSTIGAASSTGATIGGTAAGSGTLGSAGFGMNPALASNAVPGATLGSTTGGATALNPAFAPGVTPGGAVGSTSAGIPAALTNAATVPGYTPGMYASGATAMPGAAPATTNVFGQTVGQPGVLSNKALGITAGGSALAGAMGAERNQFGTPPEEEYSGPLSKFKYDPNKFTASEPTYAPGSVYRPTYAAEGGIMQAFQAGGSVDDESGMDEARGITQGNLQKGLFGRGYAPGGMVDPSIGMAAQQQSSQQSMGSQGIDSLMGNKKRMLTKEQMDAVALQGMSKEAMQDVYGQMAAQGLSKGGSAGNKDMAAVDAYIAAAQGGDMGSVMAKAQAGDYNAMIALNKVRKTPNQNYAKGGHLGNYSDGGRMLKGPGDGMSDNIPATIAGKQPARLADGEFVVPADVVSHLGNGSTDAGAKQLYAMMNRVRKARTGNPKQGKQIKPAKYMVA